MCNIPVVKQYVRRPHLVRSETEVLNSRILGLVPLEVMVVPMLRHTSKALVLHISKNTRDSEISSFFSMLVFREFSYLG